MVIFKASKTISIDGLSDQEGITLGLNGVYLYTVSEDLNAINQVDIDNSTLAVSHLRCFSADERLCPNGQCTSLPF